MKAFTWNGHTVIVDPVDQVLRLEINERGWQAWPRAAVGAGSQEPLYPSIPAISDREQFACVAAFATKAKAFDDGLYAAVELFAQKGTARSLGRDGVVRSVFGALAKEWPGRYSDDPAFAKATTLVAGALSLRGEKVDGDRWLRALTLKRVRGFRENEAQSKPIGFYTWSDELRQIFEQGRLLQEELEPAEAEVIERALRALPAVARAYERHLDLASRLTNPLVRPGVTGTHGDSASRYRSVFPPSESPEGSLMKRLYGNREIPDGFSLMDELLVFISRGDLELRPSEDSGWYDYQLFALESLVRPDDTRESERLWYAESYRTYLRGLFVALFGLNRETHIKQLEIPGVGAGIPPLIVEPSLTLEPLAEYYRRRSDSYRFVREVLLDHFAEEELHSTHRLTAAGPVERPLLDELLWMESLFSGAYLLACQEIGASPAADDVDGRLALADRATAARWIREQASDTDLAADCRCVVPLFFDLARQKTKVLAFLGFTAERLLVSFERTPNVTVRDSEGAEIDERVVWGANAYDVASPVSVECYVDRIPDREQFRALCDRLETPDRIAHSLARGDWA